MERFGASLSSTFILVIPWLVASIAHKLTLISIGSISCEGKSLLELIFPSQHSLNLLWNETYLILIIFFTSCWSSGFFMSSNSSAITLWTSEVLKAIILPFMIGLSSMNRNSWALSVPISSSISITLRSLDWVMAVTIGLQKLERLLEEGKCIFSFLAGFLRFLIWLYFDQKIAAVCFVISHISTSKRGDNHKIWSLYQLESKLVQNRRCNNKLYLSVFFW